MLDCGYCIVVNDFKAEIVEFVTRQVINMPDDSKVYVVYTKFGESFMKEGELFSNKEDLQEQYEQLSKALEKSIDAGSRDTKNRW